AEDGIRDFHVTGVQTCALPIFEVPGAQVFTKQWQPELNINLSSSAEKIDETHFEVALKVVVQATNEGDTAFIVDVTQAGIFLVDGVEEERLPYILGA